MPTYTVVIYSEPEGGFSVAVPALPGCHTQGETLQEAFRMAEDVISLYLEDLIEDREPIPEDVANFTVRLGDAERAEVFRVRVAEPQAAEPVASRA